LSSQLHLFDLEVEEEEVFDLEVEEEEDEVFDLEAFVNNLAE
jgi:hypothetical protein